MHCLVLDGIYRRCIDGTPEFVEVPAPTDEALQTVLHKIITRLMKLLTRRGVLVEVAGSTYMTDNDCDSDEARTLRPLQAAACTYRIAFGPRAGQKLLTVQGVMPREMDFKQTLCADDNGFSLHAAVRCAADERQALEQLCRYITRPALANERVQTNAAGQVVLKLKTPWRDGTTHLMMSPLEFMQRLAALVPRPRLHLIRFHGVLAPNAKLRALVVPQEPEAPAQEAKPAECEENCAHHRPVRLSWAKLLKRVFDLDLEHCPNCGGELKIIAAILEQPGNREDPHAPGSAGARTASSAGPRPSAASGLTLPNCDRSGDPAPRAAGVSCARGFPGPMESAWRQGVTRRRRPRKTLFACAVNAQQISSGSKDRFKRVGCCVLPCWGCHGEGKGRLKILSSGFAAVVLFKHLRPLL